MTISLLKSRAFSVMTYHLMQKKVEKTDYSGRL